MRTRKKPSRPGNTRVVIPFPPVLEKNQNQLTFSFTENQDLLDHSLLKEAKKGNAEKVRELVGRGASINSVDLYGRTSLIHAASQGYLKTVKTLLGMHADINLRDNYGMSAIQHAIENGRIKTASYLRSCGARW
jgi:ankyrin repeat protein